MLTVPLLGRVVNAAPEPLRGRVATGELSEAEDGLKPVPSAVPNRLVRVRLRRLPVVTARLSEPAAEFHRKDGGGRLAGAPGTSRRGGEDEEGAGSTGD